MKKILFQSLVFLALSLNPANANQTRIVAEVFTAQTGTCFYQPQGDQEIKNILSEHPDTLVLTCLDSYVTEPLLKPDEKEAFGGYCLKRKVEYGGFKEIYTFNIPMVIVNGIYDLNAAYPAQIPTGIAMASQYTTIIPFDITSSDNGLQASIPALPEGLDAKGHYMIRLVAYRPETATNPEGLMDLVNPVTAVREIGPWNGQAESLFIPTKDLENRGFAVLIQQEPYGAIIAAGRVENPYKEPL